MKSARTKPCELQLDVRLVPSLEAAIDQWLAARDEYKIQPSDGSEYDYNAAYFALGAAWKERYSEAAEVPGAFEWYRRGLIAPEDDRPSG